MSLQSVVKLEWVLYILQFVTLILFIGSTVRAFRKSTQLRDENVGRKILPTLIKSSKMGGKLTVEMIINL